MNKSLLICLVACLVATPLHAEERSSGVNQPQAIPALNATDIYGKQIDLAKLKGKVVLIDFWAIWCVPCIREMPRLEKIYNALHKEGFVIVGVASNKKTDLAAFFKRKNVPWENIADSKNVIAKDFKVRKWPASFLIDKEGKPIATNLHDEALLDKVVDALGLKPGPYKNLREELEQHATGK